ncbi:MAG: S26 family signal peptidase [Treponema sp.]|jgi:signal peptidase I|nr:S26 family signal peptidase [Treponema sp.]
MSEESVKTSHTILGALVTALIVKACFFDVVIAQGRSMEPAIKPGAVLVIGKLSYGFRLPWSETYLVQWAEPAIGDVVVFWTPSGVMAIKRCAGITRQREFIARGDNAAVSLDSASYGPVPIDHIIGKAVWMK